MRKVIMIHKDRDKVVINDDNGNELVNVVISGGSKNKNAMLCFEVHNPNVKIDRTTLR